MAAENNDNMFLTEIRSPSEANFDDDPDSALRTAYRYLKNLPKVEPNGLPADERDCEICLEAYGTNGLDQKVVRLPHCGHRFGLDCIYEWLSPTNIPNRNTCPKCRAVLFEIDHSGYSDDEDDSDTEEAPNIDIIPELRALLDLQSFESFVAALDFIEPFMQGDHLRPRAFNYSRQIHAIFHTFSNILAAEENLPNVVIVQDIARKLAALMGLLYVTFGPMMEFLQSPVPWRENGPPVHDLLDENKYEMISVWIRHFMRFESVYYQRPG